MSDKRVLRILKQLEDHEKRIRELENIKLGNPDVDESRYSNSPKQLTLAELVRGEDFKSGQEKVAVIVGFYEKILKQSPIKIKDLKVGWKVGKFDGKYDPKLLVRSIKDGLVRNIDGELDLSQTGEKFFGRFFKTDDGKN